MEGPAGPDCNSEVSLWHRRDARSGKTMLRRLQSTCNVGLLLNGQRLCRSGEGAGRDVWLHEICHGSGMALQGPRPRAKSPALQARLAELQRKLDQHQYDTMLHGIAEKVGGLRLSDLSSVSRGC